jgi:hypothetical protein
MELYVAPCENTAVVERNLIYELQPIRNKRGKGSPPPHPIEIRHKNRKWPFEPEKHVDI